MDYTKICFVVMPFGSKPVGKHKVNFDNIYEDIFKAGHQRGRAGRGRQVESRADRQGLLLG
jgi:hypothetical protein